MFLIIELVYIYSTINEVKKNVSTIYTLIASDNDNHSVYIKDISLRSMIRTHENALHLQAIDWLVLNFILKDSWKNFKIFGFDIDDATIMQKTIAVIVGLFMLVNKNSIYVF